MAQKRAKERYWEATELSVAHGNRNRKRSLNENEPYSETCEPCRYYQNLSSWDRTELQLHLRATHQNSLSYESDFVPDTWDALVDVDRGVDTGADDRSPTVRLLYSNNTISAWRNQSRTTERVNRWNREHVWPRARGVFHSGPDNRDIHHLFPASVIANEARANRYFGECMNESADEDPENYRVCGSVFQPPQSARGVVARALFYIDLRYSDSGNLLLTDDETDGFFAHRNDDGKYIMGSLSTLLKWHEEYPPGPSERTVLTEEQRNHRVCSRWQGNRNPFVDFPDLAKIIYQNHTMEDIGGNPFASCGNESEVSGTPPSDTTANTGIIQDDEESNIIVSASDDNEEVQPEGWPSPGDVMIVGVHTDNRDADNRDSVALVALRDLPAGWVIRITDNPYNQTSSEFESREGTMNLQLSSPIPAGTVFGYGQDLLYGDNWQFEKDDEHFDLSVRGDTLAVCAATATTPETCRLLSAISVAGDTAPDLPESDFSVSLGNLDNYVYTGETRATKESLQSYLLDAEQWIGSDSDTGVPGFKDQFQVVAAPLVEPVSVARLRTVSSAGQAESPIVGRAFHSRLLWGILLLACSYFLI
jgi:endonuclease I